LLYFTLLYFTEPNAPLGNLDRCTLDGEFHVAFEITYVHVYIIKLWRTQAKLILNHVNSNAHGIGQGEDRHKKRLGGGQAYERSAN
jgi:hypothetical protein